jgi:protein TonB
MYGPTPDYRGRVGALLIAGLAHGLFLYALLVAFRVPRAVRPERLFVVRVLDAGRVPSPVAKPPTLTPPGHPPSVLLITPVAVDIVPEMPAPAVAPEAAIPAPQGAPVQASTQPEALPFATLAVVHAVRPVYPVASIHAREQGSVIVGVLVDEHGRASELRVLRSSGFRRLDDSAMAAIGQWRFSVTTDGSRARSEWTRVEWQFAFYPSDLSDLLGMSLSVFPFDAAMAARFEQAAASTGAAEGGAPRGARALGRVINSLREFQTRASSRAGAAPNSGLGIELIGSWGPVKSVQFLGFGSRGLEIPFEPAAEERSSRARAPWRWERYEVTQQGGVSEWLLALSQSGDVQSAQAMTCTPSCAVP